MIIYSRFVIFWEQHDEQIPWLAKRAHQTLDKTGIFSPNHRHTFRSDSQPYRSGCRKCIVTPTTDCVESTDLTTTANQPCYFEKQTELTLDSLEKSSGEIPAKNPKNLTDEPSKPAQSAFQLPTTDYGGTH